MCVTWHWAPKCSCWVQAGGYRQGEVDTMGYHPLDVHINTNTKNKGDEGWEMLNQNRREENKRLTSSLEALVSVYVIQPARRGSWRSLFWYVWIKCTWKEEVKKKLFSVSHWNQTHLRIIDEVLTFLSFLINLSYFFRHQVCFHTPVSMLIFMSHIRPGEKKSKFCKKGFTLGSGGKGVSIKTKSDKVQWKQALWINKNIHEACDIVEHLCVCLFNVKLKQSSFKPRALFSLFT